MRLKKGRKVEVFNPKESPSGSRWRAEIISQNGHTYQVRYDCQPNMVAMEEKVPRRAIRPCPPPIEGSKNWVPGDIVEVFRNNSWKLAEVSSVASGNFFFVRLLGTSRVFRAHISDLRLRQSWQDDRWVVILKEPRKCNNGLLEDHPTKGNFKAKIPKSCVQTRNFCQSSQCFKVATHDIEVNHLVSTRCMNKRSSLCLPPLEDCTGASKKMRTIEQEGNLFMGLAPPFQLGDKVDAVSSPCRVLGENSMYASLNNNRTTGLLRTHMDWTRPTVDRYFFLGSLDTGVCESVGSCSVNNSPYKSAENMVSIPSHNLNGQDNDTEAFSGSGREPSLSVKDELAAKVHRQELHAYRCTIKALYVLGPLSWEKEALLTNLRLMLHISNDEHLSEVRHLVSSETDSRLSLLEAIPRS